nr:hypothetical protein [uncultured bacterium]
MKKKTRTPKFAHLSSCLTNLFFKSIIMISIQSDNYNTPFNQSEYFFYIQSLNFKSLVCSNCNNTQCCIGHGYYKRNLIRPHESTVIDIARVLCKHCRTTHALIPASILPHFRYALECFIYAWLGYDDTDTLSLDYWTFCYLRNIVLSRFLKSPIYSIFFTPT